MAARRATHNVRDMTDETSHAPVLIVGAGPVGLSAALALSRFGVRSVVVERRRTISPHPRARFVNARTMEFFRRMGIESEVRARSIPDGVASDVIWAPTLGAPEIRRVEIQTLGRGSGEPLSPAPGVCTSQDVLDPILYEAVLAAGQAEVRFGVRLTGLSQDADGVIVTCTDEAGGSSQIRAGYVIGADGAGSTVRELVGVSMQGPAALGRSVNIHFRADLSAPLRGRSVNLAMIMNPAQPGLLLNIDGRSTWTAQAIISTATGETEADFDGERCRAVVRAQVGDPDLEVEVLGVASWTSAARVADRLAVGRVFLAGDSAQEMPPAGGFGMNLGIQEAENLAWKLAAVLGGWAGPALLGSYEAERLPLARQVTNEALLNLRSVGRVESSDGSPPQVRLGRPEFFRECGLVFGASHASTAVIPDGTVRPALENEVSDYVPSATPGCRAPHLWIDVDGRRVSTIDLPVARFVLLQAGALEGPVAAPAGLPLRTVACTDPLFAEAYGLSRGGQVLVRPDGQVAWRACDGAGAGEVTAVLGSLVGSRDQSLAAD